MADKKNIEVIVYFSKDEIAGEHHDVSQDEINDMLNIKNDDVFIKLGDHIYHKDNIFKIELTK